MLDFPNIDPIAFQVGPFAVRWYALAYIAGIILGWRYIVHLIKGCKYSGDLGNVTANSVEDFISFSIMGIMIGGRVGYVAFYNWEYYSQNLGEIFHIWQGGMSFHGGMLGVFVSMMIFAKIKRQNFFRLADLVTAAAPIGLFFGRLANFLNGELYGRITTSKFGMIFPNGGDLPRHPSQLYEAILEGVVLFVALYAAQNIKSIREKTGVTAGLFLIGYGLARFVIEYVREPDAHIGLMRVMNLTISMGQILCLPMIVIGAIVIIWRTRIGATKTQEVQ